MRAGAGLQHVWFPRLLTEITAVGRHETAAGRPNALPVRWPVDARTPVGPRGGRRVTTEPSLCVTPAVPAIQPGPRYLPHTCTRSPNACPQSLPESWPETGSRSRGYTTWGGLQERKWRTRMLGHHRTRNHHAHQRDHRVDRGLRTVRQATGGYPVIVSREQQGRWVACMAGSWRCGRQLATCLPHEDHTGVSISQRPCTLVQHRRGLGGGDQWGELIASDRLARTRHRYQPGAFANRATVCSIRH